MLVDFGFVLEAADIVAKESGGKFDFDKTLESSVLLGATEKGIIKLSLAYSSS